jgi:hypothetical protein
MCLHINFVGSNVSYFPTFQRMMFVVAQPVHEEQMPCAAKTKEGDRKSAAFR